MNQDSQIVIIGGGAAGFFAAIRCAEINPGQRVVILEQGVDVLAKVRISGGGRCNVTHACFDPQALARFYPRGEKELRGPFTRFQPKDTIAWFEKGGVRLKTEADGRVFPITDRSETIVSNLIRRAVDSDVVISTRAEVNSVERDPPGAGFLVRTLRGEIVRCQKVLVATGGARAPFEWIRKLGHTIEEPVPSLFTLSIRDPRLKGLAGVSVEMGEVRLRGSQHAQSGPILITHWGLSGPAVLRLSAWEARALDDKKYNAEVEINWTGGRQVEEIAGELKQEKERDSHHRPSAHSSFGLPNRLWRRFVEYVGIGEEEPWASVSNVRIRRLAEELCRGIYIVAGKGPYKEEFVTCGGVCLHEVNFRTMESKIVPGIYFAGEVLDIDGITGGFNLQNAWTTGWLAGSALGGCNPKR